MSLAFYYNYTKDIIPIEPPTKRADVTANRLRRRVKAEGDNLLTKVLRWTERRVTVDKRGRGAPHGDNSSARTHFA
jgi:hypothetical protein